jgi:hypothetical protein
MTSTLLTGYNRVTLVALPNSRCPEDSSETSIVELIDKYTNAGESSYEGWEESTTNSTIASKGMVESQETLHLSCLFTRLPWITAALENKIESPDGLVKVLIVLLL